MMTINVIRCPEMLGTTHSQSGIYVLHLPNGTIFLDDLNSHEALMIIIIIYI